VRPTPRTLLAAQRDALGKHLDGIRHADPESVHDARVASRKMRELLPLYVDQRDERYGEVRDLGRRLGMVRDCDVEIELLDEFALRVPRAASLLAERRHCTMQARENHLRQVIKKLPDGTDEFTSAFPIPAAHALNDHLWSAGWRERLRSRLADRRRRALDALRYATSVYFPNRLHGARVADIHDRQLLRDFVTTREDSRDADAAAMLLPCVEYEIAWRHRRFLSRRDDLIEACGALRVEGPPVRRIAASAAGIGVATALLAIAQGRH